jgi:hypothetical protein
MGIHEYLMHLDEPRERPIPHGRSYPVDHSRRDWILYERATLARCVGHTDEITDTVRSLLVRMKREPIILEAIRNGCFTTTKG